MSYLKVYEWEAQRWPEFRTVMLSRYAQEVIVENLATRLGTNVPRIGQSYRRGASQGIGGSYDPPTKTLRLGTKSTLSMLAHEFAHHLNHEKNTTLARRRAHGKAFKACLRLSYAACRKYLNHQPPNMP